MQVSSIRWGCFTSILGAIVFSSSTQAAELDAYLQSVEAFGSQPASETNSEINSEINPLLTSVTLEQTAQVLVETPAKGTIVRLEFSPSSESRIPADGRSTVTLSGQVLDANNQPVLEDVTVTLTSSAGKFVGADQDSDRLGFQVIARQGRFSAELQSTLEPKQVRVRAAIEEIKPESKPSPAPFAYPGTLPRHPSQALEAYATVEFITNLRPSLVSGSINLRIGAAGTNYYKSFADFLSETSFDKGTQVGFDASVFAIGKVGDWLFTGAFNNTRPLNQTCDGTTRLFRDTQFCDQVYPTYGDSSTVDYLTPSIDSVFLKFERTSRVPGAGTDYAMWGDYKTEEFSTASQYFTATSRQLHGFKGNYNFGNFQATLMYGNNLEGFQRDTIAPNGTSGNYFLSRRLVIGGSESVFIETEELNRPGSIVDRIPLSRIRDYEIDYDRGTITFRNPIQTTDFDLFGRTLVRRIVVTYQYEGIGTGGTNLYAGRARYNFSREVQRESWAGVSYLREDRGSRDFELYGADALFSFGKDGQLVAEFARSTNADPFLGDVEGSAYRLEAKTSLFSGVLARGYYRSVDENFSNNATLSFVPGQTRYGGDIAAKIGASTQFRAQIDREINYGIASGFGLGTIDLFNPTNSLFCDTPGLARCGEEPFRSGRVDNSLTTISAGFEQKIGTSALSFVWVNRTREDRATNNLDQDSNQLVSRLSVPLTKTLLFRAQNELSLGDDDPLYPSRTTVGLDWKVSPGVTMRLAQQFLSGGQFSNNSITSLDTIVDRKLSEDTSMTGRYSVLNGINGTTGQGAIGLNHRIRLSPGLRINLGYERIFGDFFAYTAAGQQFAQPYAVGQSSSSLGVSSGDSYSVGVEYSDNPDFKASARFERRNSSLGNDTFWSAGAAGKVLPALTALVRFQQANAANQLLTGLGDTSNLKVGLAYRDPNSDKLNLLFRYEYRQNPDATPTSLLFGTGSGAKVHLGAIEAIYAPNFRWEFYGKYAIRSAQSSLARDLLGTNAISLGQFRTTYRLGYNWDLGGEVRWIGQSVTGFNEFGFLAEVGYYLTPNLRAAVGYSFGEINNDRDFEGSRSKGGFYVTLSFKLNELFNGFGLQRVVPPQQQQESQIKPVATQPDIPPQSQTLSSVIQSMIRDQSAETIVRGVTE